MEATKTAPLLPNRELNPLRNAAGYGPYIF